MKVYFLKRETDFGPFFSSKEKAAEYLKDPDLRCEGDSVEAILTGESSYESLEEVELDSGVGTFDG